ncbi:MAG: DMT family transporter [Rhodospirillaceae bacterium]|nr:DMT family transporter [Rhodospirillaceae bacterium]
MIPLTKYQLERWDPYFLVAIRTLGAVPLLWLLVLWTERGRAKPAPVAAWRIWTFGVIGNGGFAILYAVGVQFSDPVLAAIVTATGPAVAAVTDRVFFRLPFNRLMVPGLIASAAGCALASIDPGAGDDGIAFGGGEVLILLSVICWAWYSTVAQRWCPDWTQARITFVTMATSGVVTTAIYLLLSVVGPAQFPPAWPEAPIEGYSLLWYIITVMVLGVVLWNAGVRAVGVVTASLYVNLTPVVAIAILVLSHDAKPTTQQLLGGGLVLLGIVYSEWRILQARRSVSVT